MGPGSNNILPFSRGKPRTPNHYQNLKAPIPGPALAYAVVPDTLVILAVGSNPRGHIFGSRIKQPFEPVRTSLTQAEILLRDAQTPERHYRRPDLMPSRRLSADYTVARQEATLRQGKPVPPPSPTAPPPNYMGGKIPESRFPRMDGPV